MGVSLLYASAATTALEGTKLVFKQLGDLYRGQTEGDLFTPYDFPCYLPPEG